MKKSPTIFLALAGLALNSYAAGTKTWQQNEYADFEKGERQKLSLRSDGRIRLAPVFTEILDSSSAYLWCLAEDSKGNLYAGGGGPGGPGARIYMRSPDGTSKVLAELDSLEVHAVAIDRNDRLYAATSPDSRIYRITADGKAELFFDPGTKYIWAMAFNGKGELFVATGDDGLVYRVTPDGNGSVVFRTGEAHARSLALDANNNLIVGTEPSGLVLRITPAGEGFVLYQAPKREITAVSVAQDGSVYAAGVGDKTPVVPAPVPAPPSPEPVTPAPKPAAPARPTQRQVPQTPPAPPPSVAGRLPAVTGGSEVYRIDPGGFPRKVWSHPGDVAYAIGFDAEDRPLIGTGNKGVVYRLDSDLLYTALLTAPPTQVISFYAGRGGEIYATTGNIGKVYRIGPGLEKEGSIESDVFDAGLLAWWGRLRFRGEANGGGIRFETRSGNLDRPGMGWSPWKPVTVDGGGGRVQSPRARFVQWKLTLSAAAGGQSPEVESASVAYLPRNVAPVIEEIEITPPNYRFPPQSLTLTQSQVITLRPLGGGGSKAPRVLPVTPSGAVSMQYAKGEIGARWASGDENEDSLIHKVEIRGAGESEWKLLKDSLKENRLSWDSTAFPDGEYVLRITSSDAPDNPPGQALTAQLESEPFLVDNTPPEISRLAASLAGGKVDVRWNAKDARSLITKAEYSVNGGEWTVADPVTKLSDSRELDYHLLLERASPGEQTIAVRVTDEYDNQAVASVVVR